MMRRNLAGVFSVVVVGLAGVGCGGSAATQAPTTTSAGVPGSAGSLEDDQASVELTTHHRHHHGGFVGFIVASIETIGVSPEQQAAVDKIQADFKLKVEPVRAANGAMMLALADGVAAGALDQAKLDAALAAVTAAAGSVHGASADALNALHNALTPEQRQALVDKIDAHWSIWKDSNAGDQATDNARPEGHIARLAQEIGLTNEQVDKTRAALAALPPASRGPFDPAAAEAHVKAFSAAFVAPQFDARTLTTADPANKGIASWGATRMVHFYQALTPVLTPEQRAKVAATLREHANEP